MTNKDFIKELSQKISLTEQETQRRVNALIRSFTELLEDEGGLRISGFGLFETKKYEEKVLVHPVKKQRMLVPPKMTLRFKVSQKLLDQIKEREP